jgi:two-component system sensor histidine kinase VicK
VRAPQHIAGLVADSVPSALVYLDSGLHIRFANRYCYDLLGYAPREILGRGLGEMLDERTLRYARSHAAQLELGNAAPLQYVLRHKDGTLRYVKVRAIPDRDELGRHVGYFACTSDCSAERGTRELLDAVLDRCGHGRAKLSHDLRTPLASVVAALELLHEGVEPSAEATDRSLVAVALQNADRLARLVDHLLELECSDQHAAQAPEGGP